MFGGDNGHAVGCSFDEGESKGLLQCGVDEHTFGVKGVVVDVGDVGLLVLLGVGHAEGGRWEGAGFSVLRKGV